MNRALTFVLNNEGHCQQSKVGFKQGVVETHNDKTAQTWQRSKESAGAVEDKVGLTSRLL